MNNKDTQHIETELSELKPILHDLYTWLRKCQPDRDVCLHVVMHAMPGGVSDDGGDYVSVFAHDMRGSLNSLLDFYTFDAPNSLKGGERDAAGSEDSR